MLILTKLQRPSVAEDFIVCSRLTECLEQGRSRKLTLISAPAGYGKSSLVSAWLESTADASVWLSIDKTDTDLTLFLSYLVTGIRAYFPEGCPSSFEILQAAELPPFDVVAASLINDLAELATPLIIVFDDYQYIVGSDSARLITTLVQYAPHQINVVIVTRHDPNLALVQLRAKHEMLEVRSEDLRFTHSEVAVFLATFLDRPLTEKTICLFSEKTEGWAVGLRLAALSLRSSKDSAQFVERFDSAQLASALEYLMSEVLSHTTPTLREFLLKTSICNRFSPQLCDELLEFSDPAIDAESLINSLVRANLFIISIDDSHHWWRFHHLFQDLLQYQVQKRYTTQEINELHRRASAWFANNGLLDEAIHHALAADDIVGAARLIERNRQAVINMDSWHSVERWLAELPDAIKGQRPELLLAQAWVAYYRDALGAIPPLLDSAEALLEDDGTICPLQGEMAFFRSIPLFWQGESAGGLRLLSRAIDRIPEANHQARGEAELYYGMASQMAGQQEIAVKTFEHLLYGEQAPADIRKTRLLAALIFIYYLAGDLTAALQRTEQFQATAERVGSDYAVAWAHYMRGYVHYFRHELEEADRYFALAVQRRYILHSRVAVDSLVGQVLTRQALGELDAANASMAILLEFAQESNDLRNITSARSCQSRLAILQEDPASGKRWLQMADLDSDAGIMLYWLEVPRMTQCRVLIAQESEADLHAGLENLSGFWQENCGIHNTRQMIDIAALQGVGNLKLDRRNEAVRRLARAVTLAEPGGWIQPFLDLGPELADLLRGVAQQGVAPAFIARILAAFPESRSNLPLAFAAQLSEPLTNREFQVLELLSQRYRNKEIGAQLSISTRTVKRHASNIYRKLQVSGRRSAVQKAIELGYLPSA